MEDTFFFKLHHLQKWPPPPPNPPIKRYVLLRPHLQGWAEEFGFFLEVLEGELCKNAEDTKEIAILSKDINPSYNMYVCARRVQIFIPRKIGGKAGVAKQDIAGFFRTFRQFGFDREWESEERAGSVNASEAR